MAPHGCPGVSLTWMLSFIITRIGKLLGKGTLEYYKYFEIKSILTVFVKHKFPTHKQPTGDCHVKTAKMKFNEHSKPKTNQHFKIKDKKNY